MGPRGRPRRARRRGARGWGRPGPWPVGQAVPVIFPPGSSTAYIAAVLDQKKVITSARLFRYYLRVKGSGPFQAGEYTFHQHDSFGAVASALSKGPTVVVTRLTIP